MSYDEFFADVEPFISSNVTIGSYSSSVSYNFDDQIIKTVKENFGINPIEKKEEKKAKVWNMPKIKKVIFNDPATIVYWTDGTKTVVKCGEDDVFNKDAGIALCLMKKMYGNEGKFNNEIKKWCGYPKRKKEKKAGVATEAAEEE